MRIAVTGTHGTGKTTLIDDFLDAHPDYAHEQEPYWALVQQGVTFADGPNTADLEEQLAQSVSTMLELRGDPDVIFDRSPIDFLAYLDVVSESEGVPWAPSEKLLGRIEEAIQSLDVLAFLPLSQPDEITVRIEYPRLRLNVDRRLKAIVRDDELELFSGPMPRLLEVQGTRKRRLALLEAALLPKSR